MAHNDLEAQRSIVLSFRIQELHQLLTYGGMSKSGNKPTLQVHSDAKTLFTLTHVQKRALEMVESSRDPNMLTKIQDLSRQVEALYFNTLVIWGHFFLLCGILGS